MSQINYWSVKLTNGKKSSFVLPFISVDYIEKIILLPDNKSTEYDLIDDKLLKSAASLPATLLKFNRVNRVQCSQEQNEIITACPSCAGTAVS